MPEAMTVHFATNREERKKGDMVTSFGPGLNRRSPTLLRYGAADMAAKTRGSPVFSISDLRVAPESIPGLTDPQDAKLVLGSASVFEGLRTRLIKNNADLILLLHGYACDFETALSNAAELKAHWSTESRPLETAVFSWPANGEITPWVEYASDRDDARLSAKAVARSLLKFIDYIRSVDRDKRCNADIHLVAHSMGNYVLRNALQAIISDLGSRTLPRVFKNIFLMAPDEDNDAFELTTKLSRLPELSEAVQVYFAHNDRALTISDLSKGNPDRLGTTGPRTLTQLPHKVTLIDCSDVSSTDTITDGNHQYYRKRAEVINDIKLVLSGRRPEDIQPRSWIAARNCFRLQGIGV